MSQPEPSTRISSSIDKDGERNRTVQAAIVLTALLQLVLVAVWYSLFVTTPSLRGQAALVVSLFIMNWVMVVVEGICEKYWAWKHGLHGTDGLLPLYARNETEPEPEPEKTLHLHADKNTIPIALSSEAEETESDGGDSELKELLIETQ